MRHAHVTRHNEAVPEMKIESSASRIFARVMQHAVMPDDRD